MKVYVLNDLSEMDPEVFLTLDAAKKYADEFTKELANNVGEEEIPVITWTLNDPEWVSGKGFDEWMGEEDGNPEWIIREKEVRE